MSVVERIIRSWQENGLELNPPASIIELQTLRSLFGCDVPHDIGDFYGRANGMPEHVYDQHGVSFWSIPRMRDEHAKAPDSGIGFADFLISSWRFLFAVDGTDVTVVTDNVPPGSTRKPLGSFSQFLEQFEMSADDLGLL